MAVEISKERLTDTDITDAQQMSEWFADYVFGFTEEVKDIPSITRLRLSRQFGEGDAADHLTKMRDLLLGVNEEHQQALALYICGYPDGAIGALSEDSIEDVIRLIDTSFPPASNGNGHKKEVTLIKLDRPSTSNPTPRARKVGSSAVTSAKERDIEGRDSVGLYLEEIGRTPLLDAETEVELSKTIEAGLMAKHLLEEGNFNRRSNWEKANEEELKWLAEEGERAQTRFIEANLRLVVSIARKYGRAQMPMLDLIQEGNTGLMRAVEKFDFTKGYKFSTYATWWVRQAITRGIAQQARVVRLPVHVVEELNQVGSARRTLERDLGREPEPDEIAAELDIDIERVLDLMAWGRDHVSLDEPIGEDGDTSLGDLIGQTATEAPDSSIMDRDSRERLGHLVGRLNERSADIIRSRYGLIDGRQHKLADIGRRHNISAERVRQLESEAIAKLRRLADPDLSTA